MSDESIKSPSAISNFLDPSLDYFGTKTRLTFRGNCLKQDKITFIHGKIVNIYIVYKKHKNYNVNTYPTLENCLFEAVSLNKNISIDKYKYYGHGIGFDRKIFF